MKFAIFGAGCFWCIEAIFSHLNGVKRVIPGYAGGDKPHPTYEEVCNGDTGYAEVCKIQYDPKIITFEILLKVFWGSHDPTTLNKQGADIGTQYRSSIFYLDDNQRKLSEKYKSELNKSSLFKEKIVTEITKLNTFYKAEQYHHNYYKNNKNNSYCKFVIKPKLDNLFNNDKLNI